MDLSPLRWAGLLLVAGGLVFFGLGFGTAAVVPALPKSDAKGPEEKLRVRAEHPIAWRAIVVAFVVGIALAAAGVSVLASAARGDGGAVALASGHALFLVAAAVLVVAMAGPGAIVPALASELAETGAVPATYAAWDAWITFVVRAHMLLAFAGIALLGWGLLGSGTAPAWAAWGSVGFGAALAVSFATGFPRVGGLVVADLPLWVHVWGLVVGGALLARG